MGQSDSKHNKVVIDYFNSLGANKNDVLALPHDKFIKETDQRPSTYYCIQNFNALCYAVKNGNHELALLLYNQQKQWSNSVPIRIHAEIIQNASTEYQLAPNSTIYMLTALCNEFDLLQKLINIEKQQNPLSTDLNTRKQQLYIFSKQNDAGFTLLHLIAVSNSQKAYEFLQNNMDIFEFSLNTRTNKDNWGVFEYAFYYKRWQFITLLLELKPEMQQQIKLVPEEVVLQQLLQYRYAVSKTDYVQTKVLYDQYKNCQ